MLFLSSCNPLLLFNHYFPRIVSSFTHFLFLWLLFSVDLVLLFLCISICILLSLTRLFHISFLSHLSSPELWAADSRGSWKLHPFHKPSWWVSFYDIAMSLAERASHTEIEYVEVLVCACVYNPVYLRHQWTCNIIWICVCVSGLHHEGIFRVPGSQREVNLIRDAFERGKWASEIHLKCFWK